MTTEKTTMAVTQLYEITSDESRIDEHVDDEQQREHMHRMFQAIRSHPTAHKTILEYIALERHWIESSEVFDYLGEQFGHDAHLFDVLLQLKAIFAPIDQAWLQELEQEAEERAGASGNGEGEDDDEFAPGDEGQRLDEQKKSWRDEWLQHHIFPLLLALGGNDFEFGEQEAELAGWMVQTVRPHKHV